MYDNNVLLQFVSHEVQGDVMLRKAMHGGT
jgi:hypothetical protein